MIIEQLQDGVPSVEFTQYEAIGFHATSSLASAEIEQVGFLPHKIFSLEHQNQILSAARRLNLDASSYAEWLGMRSVTFAKVLSEAVVHARQGRAGGQGLMNMERLLAKITELGTDADRTLAAQFNEQIQTIRNSDSVIYVVDLSNLGARLVDDRSSGFYQVYWHPDAELPKTSEIDPSRLLAKLSVQ